MPRKLTEKSVNLTMPNDMARALKHYADRKAMMLGPFIRQICQDYIDDQKSLEEPRGRRAA